MKKITKLLVISAVFTMIFALPVMAKDVSFSSDNTDQLITLLNNNAANVNAGLDEFVKVQCGPNAKAVIAAQKALVAQKIVSVNKECAENHIDYLTKKVNEAKIVENDRLNQLNYVKGIHGDIVSSDVILAQKEYNDAVADSASKEAYLEAAKVKLASYL